MNALIAQLNGMAPAWLAALWRASWQGGLALALVWLVCRALPRLSARAKSWLWRLAYVKLLFSLIWTAPIPLPVLPARTATQPLIAPVPTSEISMPTAQITISAAAPIVTAAQPPPISANAALEKAVPVKADPTSWVLPSLAAGIVSAWLLGVVWFGVRILRDLRWARSVRRSAKLASDPALRQTAAELARQFGVREAPALLCSGAISSPMLIGTLSPAVVLPAALADGSAPSQLRLMLAHELAHLKRRDLWWVWLAAVGESLFYFHPAVWLARRPWRLAQEIACDEMVVRLTRAPAASYGEMLVSVAAMNNSLRGEPVLVTLGLSETKAMLVQRLNAMKTMQLNPSKFAAFASAAILGVGLFSILPWRLTAQETAAQTNSPPTTPATPPTTSGSASFTRTLSADDTGAPSARDRGAGAGTTTGAAGPGAAAARGRGVFGSPSAVSPVPTNEAPAHFEATVYELQIPENRIAELTVASLEAKAATPKSLNDALAGFGTVKVLYRVDQDVNLYGENIVVGSSEPMISGSTINARGSRMNSLSYISTGLITRISAAASADPKRKGELDAQLGFQLSTIGPSGVEITDGVNASTVRNVNLSQNGKPRFGKPSVLLTVNAVGGGEKQVPVAYVVRYVLTQIP